MFIKISGPCFRSFRKKWKKEAEIYEWNVG